MPLERSNPLPPNRIYTVDVPPDAQDDFREWLDRYKGAVKVKSTSREPMETGFFWDSGGYLDKYIFEVTAPLVFWEGPGFPNRGESTVEYENYTNVVSGKVPVDPVVESPEMKKFKQGAWIVGGVIATIVAVNAFVGSALPKLLLRKT